MVGSQAFGVVLEQVVAELVDGVECVVVVVPVQPVEVVVRALDASRLCAVGDIVPLGARADAKIDTVFDPAIDYISSNQSRCAFPAGTESLHDLLAHVGRECSGNDLDERTRQDAWSMS